MKVVILAGGLGTRLREETDIKPKPMVEIGGHPIIWHIMSHYAESNLKEFVICVGYKGEVIKQWFSNFRLLSSDFTVKYGKESDITFHDDFPESNWEVTIADTGIGTPTGGRIKMIQKFTGGETFLCTYVDGLSDVDIDEILAFHKSHGKIATLTTVRPLTRFGVIEISPEGEVNRFREKPQTDGWINAGFFVFEPQIFDYLDFDSILEQDPLEKLASDGQLMAYRHDGFWQPMDTFREKQELEAIWNSGNAPWKNNPDFKN